MKTTLGILALWMDLLFISTTVATGQCNRGFFGDGSGGAIFYVTDGSTSGEGTYRNVGEPLHGFGLGDLACINNTKYLLRGGEIKTWKNGSGDVTGAKLHYRVYYQGDSPGSFNELNLSFNADLTGGNQRWKTTNHNVDLLSGKTKSGTYVIEYFFRITTNCSDEYLSNGGTNYQTYVTAYYEINTAATVTQNTSGSASVLDGNGKFVKKGTGTVQFNNANSSYSGTVFLDQGTFSIQAGAGLGNGSMRLGPGSGSSSAILELADSDGGMTLSNVIQVRVGGAGSTLSGTNTSGTNTFSGNIQFEGSTNLSISSGGTLNFSGKLDGTVTTNKTGAGTVVFSGTEANPYLGDLTVSAGTLTLNKNANLKATDDLILNSGTTLNTGAANQWGTGTPPLLTANGSFNLNNNNQRVALTGTTGSISLGTGTMTIFNTGTDTYSGAITATAGNVVKDGSGTQTLSGTLSYTGSTTATAGTLLIGNNLASTALTVNGGRLETTSDNRIADAAVITVTSGTLDLQTDAIGTLNVSSTGTVELNAAKTLTVSALNATADGRFSAPSNSTLTLASGTHSIQTETLQNLTLLPGATLTVIQGKTLTINGTLNLQGGTIVLQAGAIPAALVYGTNSELYYNTATSVSPSLEWSSTISPNTVRVGNGTTLTLASSSLSTRNFTVETGGTLALGSYSLEIRSGGTLANNGTFNANTGIIVFKGSNSVTGSSTTGFYNADVDDGGVNFGSTSQLSNNLRILSGGFVNTNRPTYGTNARLIYETGATYDVDADNREWQLGATTNNPPNVEVRTSSLLLDATAGNGLRCGNLILNATGSLTLNPPTTSVASFNLLLLSGDLTMSGTSSVTVNNGNGDDLKPTANGAYDFKISGSIVIGSGSSITLNNNIGDDLYVKEDFTINGTFDPNNRAVYFNGTALQTLEDNGSTVFNFVRVQNTGGTDPALLVTTDWTVENQLDMANGIVTTETGNTLYLNSNALLSLANINTTYLNGRTQQTKTLSGSSPVEIAYGLAINPNGNNLGSTTVITTSGTDGIVFDPVFGTSQGIAAKWEINPTTQPTSTVNAAFVWSSAHQNSKATDNLYCWRLPDGAMSWRKLNVVAYDLSISFPDQPVDSFSEFTFSDGGNPLPVELVSFEGAASNGNIALWWTTETELENDYFDIEKSRDGYQFSPIGRVEAAGSTSRTQEYQFVDTKPYPGLNYYRLRQTDLDGTFEFSEVIAVRFAQTGPDAVFPVPAFDQVYLTWTLAADIPVWLVLHDLTGREWIRQAENAISGSNRFSLSLAGLSAGSYLLELRGAGGERIGGTTLLKQ